MRKMRAVAVAAAMTAAFALAAPSADAAFMMRVSDGPTTVNLADDGINDGSAANDGVIVYTCVNCGTFTSWSIIVNTGQSGPALPGPYPHLDLNFATTSTAPATLNIWLTDTGFTKIGGFRSDFGGTTAGTVSGAAYIDTSNVEFGMGTLVGSCGPFSGGAFSCTDTGAAATSTPYSATIALSISHAGSGVSSGDFEFSVPEPTVTALFGLSLLGLAGLRRRAKK